MIDLHAHILPGLDDGPATREESLAMAQQYVRAGYLVVVATPHVMAGVYDISRAQIRQRVAELQAALRASGVPLLVVPGAEYELTSDLPAALRAGRVMTLNDAGRHLLVEVVDYHPGEPVRRTLRELRAAGVIPVIAHPERSRRGAAALQELDAWLADGALVQVTAGSLTGLFGLAAW
ncbi:MAG: phosphotransferase, partial [Syntrophomonadaceae bacterium]|nr:phosphotransferase [Syntrophomonadaceae bacterium]